MTEHPKHSETEATIYVQNIPFKTTPDELKTFFETHAPVRDVYMPRDRVENRPRGFAYVEFDSADSANQALDKFQGVTFCGRALNIKMRLPRHEHQPSEKRQRVESRPANRYQQTIGRHDW